MKKYIVITISFGCWLIGSSWASQSKHLFKVIVIGDPEVRKTAMVQKFLVRKFDEDKDKATAETNFYMKKVQIDKKSVTLQIWDATGTERDKALITPFYELADIILLCYDITNKQSLENSQEWLQNFLQHTRLGDRKVSLIVCGNKLDLPKEMRKVTKEEVDKFVQSVQKRTNFSVVTSVEVSAKSDKNTEELCRIVVQEGLKQEVLRHEALKQEILKESEQDNDTNDNNKNPYSLKKNSKENDFFNKIKKFFEANTSLYILFLVAIAGGWYLFSSTEQATDYLTDFSQDEDIDDEDEEDRCYNDVVDFDEEEIKKGF